MSEITNIETAFQKYLKFIETHKPLLIVALSAFVLWHMYGDGLKAWVAHDQRQANIAAQKVQVDALNNAQLQEKLSDLQNQVNQTNADLKAAMAQRAIDVQKQKDADDKLAGQELAARLQALLNVTPQDVQWSPINGDVVFSLPAAHDVADVVDDKNKLTADVRDLQTQLAGETKVANDAQGVIVGLNIQLADEKVSHEKDVNLEKAKAHGAWMRGFKWGTIAGVIGGEAVRIIFHKP